MLQVIKGTRDVEAALARVAATAPAWPPDGPPSLAGPSAPPGATALSGAEPPARHAGPPSAAAAPVHSARRLPAVIEAGGRRVRVELGGVEGHNSSSLVALLHGMEVHTCLAFLMPHQAPDGASRLSTADEARRQAPEEGAPASTALLFLILKSGKALRFQARL